MKSSFTWTDLAVLTGSTIFAVMTYSFDTKEKLPFTDKYWVMESSTIIPAIDVDMDGKADTDIRVMLEDCERDDAEMFKSGGKIMKHDGKNRCDEEEELVTESGTWTYDAATRQLTSKHYETSKPQTVVIKEVNAGKMTVQYSFKSAKGNHTITAVYKLK
ncbi:MAG: lipocalin family protein [Pseudobacter sp.]|uniref:lipocalin family protein n=1 Tax=Pseudobacter sp. TaxID=2045420 RepID=UPI003F7D04F3